MATWQYTFELIPKEGVEVIENECYVGVVDYDNINFWINRSIGVEYFDKLTQLLPKGKSWSKDIILYGSETSTCISFLLDKEKIDEVSIRIDFRDDYSKLLNEIIEFCNLNSMLLLDEEHMVLPLNQTSIDSVIKNSRQYIFLRDFK